MDYKKNEEFLQINCDILSNPTFIRLKYLNHHGINRYDHSVSVAYISYKIAKFLRMDYQQTARGALLHDFFDADYRDGIKGRLRATVRHPYLAVKNAETLFGLQNKEENIVKSHMFPLGIHLPWYKESWLVGCVDKVISTYEMVYVFSYRMNYASSILKLFLINLLR